MYQAVADIHRERHRLGGDEDAIADRLRVLPSSKAQVALEDLRLSATQDFAASAARLWSHMRREAVPTGRELDFERFRRWTDVYWEKRRAFINVVRVTQGQSALDWEKAGITTPRPDEDMTRD